MNSDFGQLYRAYLNLDDNLLGVHLEKFPVSSSCKSMERSWISCKALNQYLRKFLSSEFNSGYYVFDNDAMVQCQSRPYSLLRRGFEIGLNWKTLSSLLLP